MALPPYHVLGVVMAVLRTLLEIHHMGAMLVMAEALVGVEVIIIPLHFIMVVVVME